MMGELLSPAFLWLIENRGWTALNVTESEFDDYEFDHLDRNKEVDIFRCRIGKGESELYSEGVYFRLNGSRPIDCREDFYLNPDVIDCLDSLGDEASDGFAVVDIPDHIDINDLERITRDGGDVLAVRGYFWE